MKFHSLRPFIPSGANLEAAKEFFVELGFVKDWDEGDYAGFHIDDCRFILQKYDVKEFAENLMVAINVDNIEEFRRHVVDKKLQEKYGVKMGNITPQPYGKELNIIDMAGVCWHFIE